MARLWPRLVVGLVLALMAICDSLAEVDTPASASREDTLRRIVELEDQSRAYAHQSSELQRQAEDLARGMLGHAPEGAGQAALMAPHTEDLRRLMAPEGPQGSLAESRASKHVARKMTETPNETKTKRTPKGRIGEGVSDGRMPKVVPPPQGVGSADSHDALVKKAQEATKAVHEEAAAVLKHAKQVSNAVEEHRGGCSRGDSAERECTAKRYKPDGPDDRNVKPQFCTGYDNDRKSSIHTTFAFDAAMRQCEGKGKGKKKCAQKGAENHYRSINPMCASWRRVKLTSTPAWRATVINLFNTASKTVWYSKDWVLPRAEFDDMPDSNAMYTSTKCCGCHEENQYAEFLGHGCVCDKACRSDPTDPEYGYMKHGTIVRMRGNCHLKYAVDTPNGVKVDSGNPNGGHEKFTIVVPPGEAPNPKPTGKYHCGKQRYIAFQGGREGKYCANEGNRWICNRNEITDWEKFQVISLATNYVAIKSKKTGKWCQDNKGSITCDHDHPTKPNINPALNMISNGCAVWLVQPVDNSRGAPQAKSFPMQCNKGRERMLGESERAKFFMNAIKRVAKHVHHHVKKAVNHVENHVKGFAESEACKLLKKYLESVLQGDFMFLRPLILRGFRSFLRKKTAGDVLMEFWKGSKKDGIGYAWEGKNAFKEKFLYPQLFSRLLSMTSVGIETKKKDKIPAHVFPSSAFSKCSLNSFGGFMAQNLIEFEEAPIPTYAKDVKSQPLRMIMRRLPVDSKGAHVRPLCQAYFEYDFLFCEEWKYGKQCQGRLVDKPVNAGLLEYGMKGPRSSWAKPPSPWHKRNDCESWFVMMQGLLSGAMSVISASMTTRIYSGRSKGESRMCFYQPDVINDLIVNQAKYGAAFKPRNYHDKKDTFENAVEGGKCKLMTGYRNADSKGYHGRRRAAMTQKQEGVCKKQCEGGCCTQPPYDWKEDRECKWNRGITKNKKKRPWSAPSREQCWSV